MLYLKVIEKSGTKIIAKNIRDQGQDPKTNQGSGILPLEKSGIRDIQTPVTPPPLGNLLFHVSGLLSGYDCHAIQRHKRHTFEL